MKRSISLIAAAVIAMTGATGTFSSANALPLAGIPLAAAAGETQSPNIVEAKFKRHRGGGHHEQRGHSGHGHSGHRHHGGYHSGYRHHSYGGYRYRHNGYYHSDNAGVAIGFGTGLVAGTLLTAPYRTSGWTAACSRKYASFDARSGTYLGYDGYRHRCVLP